MDWSLEIKTLVYRGLKKLIINEIEASLTGDKIEKSDPGMKNNPYLLREAEVANYREYLTADESIINEDDENMNIYMEE